MPPSELSWDDARLHETESKMTSAQKDKKEEDTSNYFPPHVSEITSLKEKEQHIPDDLPPQTDAFISQGGTSIANEKEEVEFETEMMITAMDQANKVYKKNELPFRGDAAVGKCGIVLIVHSCVQFSIIIHWLF